MKPSKQRRTTCKFCSLSCSRSHYYAYGHKQGICVTNKTVNGEEKTDSGSAKKRKEYQSANVELSNTDFRVDYDLETSDSDQENGNSVVHDSESDTDKESEEEDSVGEFWSDEENDFPESNDKFEQTTNTSVHHGIIKKILTSIFLYQTISKTSDSSIAILLGVFRYFLFALINCAGIVKLKPILEQFPATLYSCKRLIGLESDQFIKWVICQKCDAIYSHEQSIKTINGKTVSAKCKRVLFPNHTIRNRRAPCNTNLMKKVTNGSKYAFHPRKLYCYKSIKTTLELLLKRPGFKELLFKDITSNTDVKTDIYDGDLWKNFKGVDGNQFFSDKRNIGLMLNVDWFQPFKNSEY